MMEALGHAAGEGASLLEHAAAARRWHGMRRVRAARRPRRIERSEWQLAIVCLVLAAVLSLSLAYLTGVSPFDASRQRLSEAERQAAATDLMDVYVAWIESYRTEHGELPQDLGALGLPWGSEWMAYTRIGGSGYRLTLLVDGRVLSHTVTGGAP